VKLLWGLTRWFFSASVAGIWLTVNIMALLRNAPLSDIPVWYHLLAAALFIPNLLPEIISAWKHKKERNNGNA